VKAAKDLQVGDVMRSKLLDDKAAQPRVIVRVRPRTGLTYVETQHKQQRNQREVFELRSNLKVIV
jgi:hypothetical protein